MSSKLLYDEINCRYSKLVISRVHRVLFSVPILFKKIKINIFFYHILRIFSTISPKLYIICLLISTGVGCQCIVLPIQRWAAFRLVAEARVWTVSGLPVLWSSRPGVRRTRGMWVCRPQWSPWVWGRPVRIRVPIFYAPVWWCHYCHHLHHCSQTYLRIAVVRCPSASLTRFRHYFLRHFRSHYFRHH